jgi:hypothetical protein
MCGGGPGDGGSESTLFFSGPRLPSPRAPALPPSLYYPFRAGYLVLGTVSGTPRAPALTGLRPNYQYAVVLGPGVGCEAAGGTGGAPPAAGGGATPGVGGAWAPGKRQAGPRDWVGVVDVRCRTALRQVGVVRAVASNGWSAVEAAVRTSETGASAVLGPIVGKVLPTAAVVLLEVDVRARVRCVLTNAFSGDRCVVAGHTHTHTSQPSITHPAAAPLALPCALPTHTPTPSPHRFATYPSTKPQPHVAAAARLSDE